MRLSPKVLLYSTFLAAIISTHQTITMNFLFPRTADQDPKAEGLKALYVFNIHIIILKSYVFRKYNILSSLVIFHSLISYKSDIITEGWVWARKCQSKELWGTSRNKCKYSSGNWQWMGRSKGFLAFNEHWITVGTLKNNKTKKKKSP